MQQRVTTATVDTEEGIYPSSTPPSRSRHNSKPKILVRSHAMREETSPPREPSPSNTHHHYHLQHPLPPSPRIELIPSPIATTSSPAVTLSPSLNPPSRGISPATLVPSSSRCSPNLCGSPGSQIEGLPDDDEDAGEAEERFVDSSPNFTNELFNLKTEDSSKQTSRSFKKKYICDCQNQNCLKCVNAQERNINNNLKNVNNTVTGSPNMLSVSEACGRRKLKQQSSSQGSFESTSMSPCLSRDSSSDQYTDTTGVDLEMFIPETLNRNAKDRALMLRIEQELVNLAKDTTKTHYKFPPMSSYQRMLVHRCAAYFGMDHNIEPTGKSVVVNKTSCTRIPKVGFRKHIKEDIIFSEEPRRSILKRDSNSIEDYRSYSLENRRSKSFEEREEEYEKVRRRIFNREQMHDGSSEDFSWPEIPWSSTESDCSARYRLQPPDVHRRQMGKLVKGHSEETGETQRPCVAKSYSFGGYGGGVSVLSRGDSVMSSHSAGPRLLTKQDSGASSVSWRLSPSSSGYKSQSQMSDSVTPSPTSTPHPQTEGENVDKPEVGDCSGRHVVWAVTDLQNVPKGSIIINPQTGKPLKNEDGSLYHYDPHNLPPGMAQPISKPPPSPQKVPPKEIQYSPKKTRSVKTSPTRKSTLTNSSTSPSLPFSPPLVAAPAPHRSYSYAQTESMGSTPQQFGGYQGGYAQPLTMETGPNYSQPYLVYTAPYGVQVQQQYDGRMEGTVTPIAGQDLSSFTNTEFDQSIHIWPTGPNNTPLQKYSPAFMTAAGHTSHQGYMPGYVQPGPAPQMNPNEAVIPNQTRQIIYQGSNAFLMHGNPLMYYQQTPFFSPHFPPPQVSTQFSNYTQGTPPSNFCNSGYIQAPPNTGYDTMQLTQNMNQLSMGINMQDPGYKTRGPMLPQDPRLRNYIGKPIASHQRMNTTSPAPPAQFVYPSGPMMYHQMNNPGGSSSAAMTCSRSTTPASDIAHFEKLTPSFYYHVPVEHTLISERGQASMIGQPIQETNKPMSYNNRSRKIKNTKASGLPPSGK